MASQVVETPQEVVFTRPTSCQEPIVFNRNSIISTVAVILSDIIKEQEKKSSLEMPSTTQTLFHAKKIPGISIQDYLKRIGEYAQCSDDCFIYALIYIDQIGEKHPDFSLDKLNIHRILLMSTILAAKFYDDKFYENKYYASIGGVSVKEFVLLEKEYLFKYIDFKLYINPETYNLYYTDLFKYYKEKVLLNLVDSH